MVEGENWRPIEAKRKAITALLPYALRKERDGEPEMFDAFMRAVRASKDRDFTWRRIRQYASRIPHETSPRAIVLVFPHIRWRWLTTREDLIQRWAAAASAVPCTEEVAQSVVNTLLQIASQKELISHIPADAWLWLAKRPSLPPVCRGRDVGTRAHVVRAVRALKDIEALKSYFLLVWSEWNHFSARVFHDQTTLTVPDSQQLRFPGPGMIVGVTAPWQPYTPVHTTVLTVPAPHQPYIPDHMTITNVTAPQRPYVPGHTTIVNVMAPQSSYIPVCRTRSSSSNSSDRGSGHGPRPSRDTR